MCIYVYTRRYCNVIVATQDLTQNERERERENERKMDRENTFHANRETNPTGMRCVRNVYIKPITTGSTIIYRLRVRVSRVDRLTSKCCRPLISAASIVNVCLREYVRKNPSITTHWLLCHAPIPRMCMLLKRSHAESPRSFSDTLYNKHPYEHILWFILIVFRFKFILTYFSGFPATYVYNVQNDLYRKLLSYT